MRSGISSRRKPGRPENALYSQRFSGPVLDVFVRLESPEIEAAAKDK